MYYGALGLGNNVGQYNTARLNQVHGINNVGYLRYITMVSAGAYHSMALDANNFVMCWGDGKFGQLGINSTTDYNVPKKVLAPDRNGDDIPDDLDGDPCTVDYFGDDIPVIKIAAGYWHNLAVDAVGRLYTWGRGADGRLALGSTNDALIPKLVPLFYNEVWNVTQNKYYEQIQPAIDEANDADLIKVYEGIYAENVDMGTVRVTLQSGNPADSEIVYCTQIIGSTSGGNALSFTDNLSTSELQTIVEGFTISSHDGYGVKLNNSDPVISKCVVKDSSYGIYAENYSLATVDDCTIKNNSNAGIDNSDSLKMVKCLVSGNVGIGIDNSSGSSPDISICIIKQNNSHGISINQPSSVNIRNNWIVNNGDSQSCDYGIYLTPCPMALLRNNTIAQNTGGGICRNDGGDPNIINCIIWDNGSSSSDNLVGTFSYVTYNCIEGGYSGQGNISDDPNFVDAGAGNYHIPWDSSCFNAGLTLAACYDETDIDGEDRVYDEVVDIGADECYHSYSDFNDDDEVNFEDFAILSAAWGSQTGQGNWNVLCDLIADGHINSKDLEMFIQDWLWQPQGAGQMQSFGYDEGLRIKLDAETLQKIDSMRLESAAACEKFSLSADISAEKIEYPKASLEEILSWLEEVRKDDEVQKTISNEEWDAFIKEIAENWINE